MERPARSRVYLGFALSGLGAAAVGFFTTYLRPVWRGEFHGPPLATVHGAFVLGWLLLFAAQVWLVRAGNTRQHRALGWIGLAIVPGVVWTTIAMGVYAMKRDLAAGMGEVAVSLLVGTVTSPLLFAAVFAGGIAYRRKSDVHKRLMLLATLTILWPAFLRFRHYFPAVPRPDVWFGFVLPQSMTVIAMLHDKATRGRVHPAYWTVGVFLIAEAAAEVVLFDTPGWRVVAHWLAAPFLP